MDPMQAQNQQPIGAVQQPVAPVQYVVQNIPQQPVVQQQPIPQQPVVQQDSVFDKILKGLVDFIGKLAAPAPSTPAPQQIQGQQGVQQPQMQEIPGANFFNKIGSTLDTIGNQAEQMIQNSTTSVIQGTQNYVAQQPSTPLDTQQFLSQNYQPNTMPQQPVAPVQQPIPQQPVVQQPIPQQPVMPSTPNQ